MLQSTGSESGGMKQDNSPSVKLELFFKEKRHFSYSKGDTILHAGDEPRGVFYLIRGYVRLYSISKEGEELTLIIFKPQDFFPMMWVINNTPQDYYLEAMTNCELYRAHREEFITFMKRESDVEFDLLGKILTRLGGLLSRMEYLAFGNAHQKVASILLICAERFGTEHKNETVVQVPLTHKDIADLVGVTRETASIEIKKLERKGLIAFHGRRVIVKNKPALRHESLLEE